jgi:urease accessory protein
MIGVFMKKRLYSVMIALGLSLIPVTVFAHEGGNVPFGGFLAGLVHPVLGYDHLLAMLCVGIISAQIGGKAIWTVPSTFVGVMAVGGALGLIGIGALPAELGISLSLVLLGGVIAAERQFPIWIAMIVVGIFAVFHGYAHGLEMPESAKPVAFALGFLTGTAIIHIVGVFIGDISQHYKVGKIILRVAGGLILVVGLLLVIGIL